jgi:4-amino-4-deoxy-L-arabinose transferase-like glycosyltransferase
MRIIGSDRRFVLLAVAILVVETVAVLLLSSKEWGEITTTDGRTYDLIADNAFEHGAFSVETSPPYEASVFRTPGYPLFLMGIHLFAGNSILAVQLVQFVLVGLIAATVYLIGREIAGLPVARVGALLCLTYLPLLWFARHHLTEVVSTALTCLVVLLLVRLRNRADTTGIKVAAVIGLLLGVATTVRPNLALAIAPVAALLVFWPVGSPRRQGIYRAVIACLVFVCILTPWTIRNFRVTDTFLPLAPASGSGFYISAQQYAGNISYKFGLKDWDRLRAEAGSFTAPYIRRALRERSDISPQIRQELAQRDAYENEADKVIATLTVSEVVKSLPERIAYLWSVSDFPPDRGFTVLHRIGQAQYAALVLLGIAGLVVFLRSADLRRWLAPLTVFALYLTCVHLVFPVEARYSFPARPVLLVLPAVALIAAWRRVRAEDSS